MSKIFKITKITLCMLLTLTIMGSMINNKVHAFEDGAYTVGMSATYINPDTGLTSKGAASNATGENMVAKIMAPDVLVEQSNGKTYVTLGLGMGSSLSNVRMQIQTSAGGGFQQVAAVSTGSSTLNGDTCVHYRFEVVSPNLTISPKFTVDGMGSMELEFYIVLNMNSMTPGSSRYVSQMVETETKVEEEVVAAPSAEEIAAAEAKAEAEKKLEAFMDPATDPLNQANGLSTHKIVRKKQVENESTNSTPIVIITVVALAAIAAGVFIVYKKKRGLSNEKNS